MSFSISNINSGNFISVVIIGYKGIATSLLGLFYTTNITGNGGSTWAQATDTNGGGVINTNYGPVSLVGSIAIAGSNQNRGIWYSTNSGQTWTRCAAPVNSDSFPACALSSTTNGVASSGKGVYYTLNGGQTWTQSNLNRSPWGTNTVTVFALSGNYGIAGTSGGGAYYTTDSGANWVQGAGISISISCADLVGLNGVVAGNNGMYYTTNGGQTWNQSTLTSGGTINFHISSVSLYNNGSSIIGATGTGSGVGTSAGLYYTTNGGSSWSASNFINTGNTYPSIDLLGNYGVSGTSLGLNYTMNGGITWITTNVTTGNFNSVSLYDTSSAIAGSSSGNGIYYLSSPLCFNEGTKILCLNKNFQEEYIPIENLRSGDLVKTYKYGYKKIDLIAKGQMFNDPNHLFKAGNTYINTCMHKMVKTDTNELIEDLIVSGRHSILVDDLGEYADIMAGIFDGSQKIDGKFMLVAGKSKDFVKIEEIGIRTYYHLCLENDGDNYRKFGIWANGILIETTHRNDIISNNLTLL